MDLCVPTPRSPRPMLALRKFASRLIAFSDSRPLLPAPPDRSAPAASASRCQKCNNPVVSVVERAGSVVSLTGSITAQLFSCFEGGLTISFLNTGKEPFQNLLSNAFSLN